MKSPLLLEVTAQRATAYALIQRPGTGAGTLEVLVGEPVVAGSLADPVLPPLDPVATQPDLIAVVPYRQIGARGLACVDDACTGAVHALSARRMRSVRFHIESVLTENGTDILGRMLAAVLSESNGARPSSADGRQVTGRQA